MRPDYLVFGAPQILQEDIDAVAAVLRTGWIGTGPVTKQFERNFAGYVGAPDAAAVSSCTAALHLALEALGVGRSCEVIVPALTFASTASAVLFTGARPVFCDVDAATMCMTPETVEPHLTSSTEAIIPVHFAGRACDIRGIMAAAEGAPHASGHVGVGIVEDCAHAIETILPCGSHAGTVGNYGAFSFYATKNVTTGEGGMVVEGQAGALLDRVRRLSLHGLSADAWKRFTASGSRDYEIEEFGFKYNMTDVQAALGIRQLDRVERNLARRQRLWGRYDALLAGVPGVERPAHVDDGSRHACHLYTVLVDDRDRVAAELHRRNIGTGIHYRALHLHPYYRRTHDHAPGDFPNAEAISARTLSLPLTPAMTLEDVEYVADSLVRAVTGS